MRIAIGVAGILFVSVLGIFVQWAGMIYGWGMVPKSWPVIIGTFLTGTVFMFVTQAIGKWSNRD